MVEMVLDVLINTVLTGIFYWPGWLVLRMVTLGHYPPRPPQAHNQMFVAMIGIVALVLPVIFWVAGVS